GSALDICGRCNRLLCWADDHPLIVPACSAAAGKLDDSSSHSMDGDGLVHADSRLAPAAELPAVWCVGDFSWPRLGGRPSCASWVFLCGRPCGGCSAVSGDPVYAAGRMHRLRFAP